MTTNHDPELKALSIEAERAKTLVQQHDTAKTEEAADRAAVLEQAIRLVLPALPSVCDEWHGKKAVLLEKVTLKGGGVSMLFLLDDGRLWERQAAPRPDEENAPDAEHDEFFWLSTPTAARDAMKTYHIASCLRALLTAMKSTNDGRGEAMKKSLRRRQALKAALDLLAP